MNLLEQPLQLRCGAVIKNRFLKSAMSEALASVDHGPTKELSRLYATWAKGGSGLVVSGNIMIDARALGEPRNVVVEDERNLSGLQEWAKAGTLEQTHLWAQLNHPGKQSPILLSKEPVAPSPIPLGPGYDRFFARPRALSEREIEEIIERFAQTALICKKAGFTGVQIHGAHGYLVNQFLSPLHNQRNDHWGGSLENRMRFVLEAFQAIRKKVGSSFPIGIKINSADFMKGGFCEEDSLIVMKALSESGIDLIEISGGNYESPSFVKATPKPSTQKREAYFMEFAEQARKHLDVPIAVTGGFRTANGMIQALEQGAMDMVGIARPLALYPDLPNRILSGENPVCPIRSLQTGIGVIDRISLLEITWYEQQMERLAKGKNTKPNHPPLLSLIQTLGKTGFQVFQKRRS